MPAVDEMDQMSSTHNKYEVLIQDVSKDLSGVDVMSPSILKVS